MPGRTPKRSYSPRWRSRHLLETPFSPEPPGKQGSKEIPQNENSENAENAENADTKTRKAAAATNAPDALVLKAEMRILGGQFPRSSCLKSGPYKAATTALNKDQRN